MPKPQAPQRKDHDPDIGAASALLETSSLTVPISELDRTNPHYQRVVDQAVRYARLIRLNSQTPADLRDHQAQHRAAKATAAAIADYATASEAGEEGVARRKKTSHH